MVRGNLVFIVRLECHQSYRRVICGGHIVLIVSDVVVILVKQRAEVYGGAGAGTADGCKVLVLMAVGVRALVSGAQPFEELLVQIQTA